MGEFLPKHNNLNQTDEKQARQVMVVDSQEVFRRKIRDILHGIGGFKVVAETASGRIALETAKRMQIDLVIAEFTLKERNSAELTTSLKQLPTPPRVILFSTTGQDAALVQAILAGVDGYLVKDTPTRDIIRAFRNFERGGPAMQPAVTANVINLLVERCKRIENQHVAHIDDPKRRNLLVYSLETLQGTSQTTDNGALSLHGSIPQSKLSPQEEKVFSLLRHGQSNKQIAAKLAISPYTVGKHVQNILRKLGVANRTQAAAYTPFAEGNHNLIQD